MSKHHVIFKSQGGSDHEFNKIELSEYEHFIIHHGTNLEEKIKILTKCYDYILPNLKYCWKGKLKPKIVRLLENSKGDYSEIFKRMRRL
jgi:hypothetical protein